MRLVTDDIEFQAYDASVTHAASATNGASASADVTDAWTPEVDMILSAMEAANSAQTEHQSERRSSRRTPHRTLAKLSLFAQSPLLGPTVLFTRDVTTEGLGFITRERVPLGCNGLVTFTDTNGISVTRHGQVYRCREAINGWYEGSLRFAATRTS